MLDVLQGAVMMAPEAIATPERVPLPQFWCSQFPFWSCVAIGHDCRSIPNIEM